jgi:cation:H+ antiporter
MTWLQLLGGLVLLAAGAELLVRGAAGLAARLGLSALVAAGGLEVAPPVLRFDLPMMVAVAVATAPIALARGVIGRAHGLFFLGAYAAYMGYLVLDSTGHDALPALSTVMLEFVLPIVAVTLIVLLVQGLRRTSRGPEAPHA